MRISDYCRLLLKKFPHDENVTFLIALLKEAKLLSHKIHSIEIEPWENGDAAKYAIFTVQGYAETIAEPNIREGGWEMRANIYLQKKPNTWRIGEIVCALAHELGHILRNLNMTVEQFAVHVKRLNGADFVYKLLGDKEGWAYIMEEEMVAWAYARVILKSIGWKDWAYFEQERRLSLMTYEYKENIFNG